MDATEDHQGASCIQEENTSDQGDQNLQIDNGKISNDNATAVHFQWAQIGLNQTEGDSSSPQQHRHSNWHWVDIFGLQQHKNAVKHLKE